MLRFGPRVLCFIPEGCLRIAQRFSVGSGCSRRPSPEGTAVRQHDFSRPFGTEFLPAAKPNAKALGYFRLSLRDNALAQATHPETFGVLVET
jgi:hypothetical protein